MIRAVGAAVRHALLAMCDQLRRDYVSCHDDT